MGSGGKMDRNFVDKSMQQIAFDARTLVPPDKYVISEIWQE